MRYHLRLAGHHWAALRAHLFPGDELEAVALLLCGLHRGSETTALCVRDLILIPHDSCRREPDLLCWPVAAGLPFYEEAMRNDSAVVKIHSHPGGYPEFSRQDDRSDTEFFENLSGWTDGHVPHGSAVMLPDGRIFGRVLGPEGQPIPLARIAVAGSDLHFFDRDQSLISTEADVRNIQAFGPGTVRLLKSMRVGIAGCSGTGSWTVEMLARLGVMDFVLVDPDVVTEKNLNRIVNSTAQDASDGKPKVDVMRRAIGQMGFGARVTPLRSDLRQREVVLALAGCDILVGCMDSADGRDVLNRIASRYCIPYFDIGVRLDADGRGGVNYVGGACHYLRPGGSSLLSRGVISPDAIAADSLHRHDPTEYHRRRQSGYIRGVAIDSPAVSSVNGLYASLGVNDLLARLIGYRDADNREIDAQFVNLSGNYLEHRAFPEPCRVLSASLGWGDRRPLLDLPGL
jgi:hypothetical protein